LKFFNARVSSRGATPTQAFLACYTKATDEPLGPVAFGYSRSRNIAPFAAAANGDASRDRTGEHATAAWGFKPRALPLEPSRRKDLYDAQRLKSTVNFVSAAIYVTIKTVVDGN
jgi:hypothetical protein